MKPIQYIIVRTDLKFSKGAIAVNVAHASVAAIYKSINTDLTQAYLKDTDNMTKICLKVTSEQELLVIYELIKEKSYLWIEQPENIPVAVATFPNSKDTFPELKSLKLFT